MAPREFSAALSTLTPASRHRRGMGAVLAPGSPGQRLGSVTARASGPLVLANQSSGGTTRGPGLTKTRNAPALGHILFVHSGVWEPRNLKRSVYHR